MGDSAVQHLASRFIEEFNKDVTAHYEQYYKPTSGLGTTISFVSLGLGFDGAHCQVNLYLELEFESGSHTFNTEDFVFDCHAPDADDVVEMLAELLGVDEKVIIERLVKAEIFPALTFFGFFAEEGKPK